MRLMTATGKRRQRALLNIKKQTRKRRETGSGSRVPGDPEKERVTHQPQPRRRMKLQLGCCCESRTKRHVGDRQDQSLRASADSDRDMCPAVLCLSHQRREHDPEDFDCAVAELCAGGHAHREDGA
eukprot:Amastigsp_a849552_7.p3 type:complete len:126 gc:universal Amastigsp_a849552_7:145-522(+)